MPFFRIFWCYLKTLLLKYSHIFQNVNLPFNSKHFLILKESMFYHICNKITWWMSGFKYYKITQIFIRTLESTIYLDLQSTNEHWKYLYTLFINRVYVNTVIFLILQNILFQTIKLNCNSLQFKQIFNLWNIRSIHVYSYVITLNWFVSW